MTGQGSSKVGRQYRAGQCGEEDGAVGSASDKAGMKRNNRMCAKIKVGASNTLSDDDDEDTRAGGAGVGSLLSWCS